MLDSDRTRYFTVALRSRHRASAMDWNGFLAKPKQLPSGIAIRMFDCSSARPRMVSDERVLLEQCLMRNTPDTYDWVGCGLLDL